MDLFFIKGERFGAGGGKKGCRAANLAEESSAGGGRHKQ
jgi:hypothetical protein